MTSRPPTDTDEALMLAFQAGNVSAFDTLYQRYRGRLHAFLAREAGSVEAGEEIYQEAWLRLIRDAAKYQVQARFGTYLYTLAHSCLMDYWRKQGRRGAHEEAVDELPDSACPLPNPEASWGRQLTAHALADCLAQLPAEQREVFLLKEDAEFSLADIAHITGASVEAAKSRLRYAIKKLRGCLSAFAGDAHQPERGSESGHGPKPGGRHDAD